MKQYISIEGMSCAHCVNHVKGALSSIEGVQKTDVNLHKKNAIIESDIEINDALIIQSIKDIGYKVIEIKS
ncbi:Copper chaperone CopZ [Petrocella atlantisensis]|uniref:Copper chaperone CopZ n=1 Tax=Petrocella atlantisensis TaxID=2173034 RepID=A0A3P7Q0L3_9FIRM|nr:heavy metal-associated domain-containing protein [Petrocella atlantisensis]VDN49277.1 Copper chaperone CopZ [Petrocella atlantisensis]